MASWYSKETLTDRELERREDKLEFFFFFLMPTSTSTSTTTKKKNVDDLPLRASTRPWRSSSSAP